MANNMIDDLVSKLKDEISKVLSEPPKYEDVVLPDGFRCSTFVKPKFMLKDLGYDYTTYDYKEFINIIKNVAYELKNFYIDSGIYLKCTVPNKTVQDFVFEVSMP